MFGLILLYSALCAVDTAKKRLATTNYVDCKLSDKVNTSSILHAPRDDYDVNDVLSADVVVNMFDKYYDKDYIDKQDFIGYITADDKKCFSKYSDDIWMLDNPPNIDSYVVNIRIISGLDGVDCNASVVVENGNTTSIRNIGHYGGSDIVNSWVFYPSNFTFYTISEFSPVASISACITSMYSGKYYSVEYIDNAITSLEDKIRTAAGGNYLSMDSVISDKRDVYEDDDVLTYKVLEDTYASQQALTTLKDSIYSKVEVDDMLNGDYREYITADDARCFSGKGEYTWILNNPPAASSYTLNITFKNGNTDVNESITVVDNKVEHHLITDLYGEDYFMFNPDDFTFYIDGNSAYTIFRPGYPGSSACVTAMYSGIKGVLYDYYSKDEVDKIKEELNSQISAADNKYILQTNVKSAFQNTYDAYDVFSAQFTNSTFATKDELSTTASKYYDKNDIDGMFVGDYTEYITKSDGVCFYASGNGKWELTEYPSALNYTLEITFTSSTRTMHDTIRVEDGRVISYGVTDSVPDKYRFSPQYFQLTIEAGSDFQQFSSAQPGTSACIDAMYDGNANTGYYTREDINNRVFGDYKEYVPSGGKTCFTERDANTWELRNFPIVPSYTLVVTYGNGQDMRYEDTITVENGVVTGQSLTNGLMSGGTYEFRARDFSIHISDDNFFANVRPGADGDPRACIASMHSGEHKGMLHDYYTKAEVDDIRDVLDKKITEAAGGDYIPTGNIETTLPDESVADDNHVLSTKASMSAFASKTSLTELGSTVTTINNKLTTDGVDNYLKRAEVINITSAIDKKQLDTHIALSADSAALIALENKDKEDQVVRKNDPDYTTLVNKSTVEDIVSRSKLYYRKGIVTLLDNSDGSQYSKPTGYEYVVAPQPGVSKYTITVKCTLKNNRGTVTYIASIADGSVVYANRIAVVDGDTTIGECTGDGNVLELDLIDGNIRIGFGASEQYKREFSEFHLESITAPDAANSDAIASNSIATATIDDDHILTAAATKALITNRAHTAHNTAEFTTRIDTSAKFIYLAVEACDDDYVYEGVLPIGVLSVNEKCTLNIANNDDMISFKVVNSDDGKDEVFDIRLVVY